MWDTCLLLVSSCAYFPDAKTRKQHSVGSAPCPHSQHSPLLLQLFSYTRSGLRYLKVLLAGTHPLWSTTGPWSDGNRWAPQRGMWISSSSPSCLVPPLQENQAASSTPGKSGTRTALPQAGVSVPQTLWVCISPKRMNVPLFQTFLESKVRLTYKNLIK